MRKQDASQWVLFEVNVPFFCVVNSSGGGEVSFHTVIYRVRKILQNCVHFEKK